MLILLVDPANPLPENLALIRHQGYLFNQATVNPKNFENTTIQGLKIKTSKQVPTSYIQINLLPLAD